MELLEYSTGGPNLEKSKGGIVPGESAPASHVRLPALDGLRGLAALCVLASNIWNQMPPSSNTWPAAASQSNWMPHGDFAAAIFFVLSGFCLMSSSLRGASPLDNFPGFLWRRVRRIWPAYYASLLLTLLLIRYSIGVETGTAWDLALPVTAGGVISHILLVQNAYAPFQINPMLWSMACQWQSYFLFTILLSQWERRRAWMAARTMGFFVIAQLLLMFLLGGAPEERPFGFRMILMQLAFFAGMGAAKAALTNSRRRSGRQWHWVFAISLSTFATVWSSGVLPVPWRTILMDVLAGTATVAALLIMTATEPNRLETLFRWRPFVLAGAFSFSLYLTQLPVLQLLRRYDMLPNRAAGAQPILLFGMLAILSALLAAYLFSLVFEKPFRAVESPFPFGKRQA